MVKSCKMQKTKPDGYHFKECGLNYVYLMNGFELIDDPEDGKCTIIHDANKLHREIARSVLLYKEKLSHQEVRFFRSLLQLTQEQLGKLLKVSTREIQRWENPKEQDITPGYEDLLRIIMWEEYLDEAKAIKFLEKANEERPHYKYLKMIAQDNTWKLMAA